LNTLEKGGPGSACMVFADRYPDYAASFLRKAYYNMPAATTAFPEGVYVEDSGYWEYGTSWERLDRVDELKCAARV